jgi:hypothetical protein
MIYYEVPKEDIVMARRLIIHALSLLLSKEEWEKAKKLGSLLEKFLPPLACLKDTQWISKEHLYLADSYTDSGIAADVIFHPKCRKHILDEEADGFVAYIGKIEGNKMKWIKEVNIINNK